MTQLARRTFGNPEAPALLLLHGFMSSNAQWLLNIEALSRDYFLVLVELWGHGESDLPEDLDRYSVAGYVSEFERIREELGVEGWGLIGQSYGAGLMVHYALSEPGRCNAVVVTNSRSAFGQLANEEGEQNSPDQQDSSDHTDFDSRKLPYHPIHSRRLPVHVKEALIESADAITAAAIKHGGSLGSDLNCIELLGDLEPPLLITNGIYEKSFQPELELLLSRHPELEIVNLEGGHSINIEAAESFNQAVLTFLMKIKP
jgi:2-succinyl-6-hydroxy-2,4-cyclohexadiene-1-carboxylate synthase